MITISEIDNVNPETKFSDLLLPNVWNPQGLNACTACAFSDLISQVYKTSLSPMFLYYNARKLIDKLYLNCTLELKDILDAYQQFGICEEKFWPFDLSKFSRAPSNESYENALFYGKENITSVPQEIDEIINVLRSGQYIFIGLRFYRSNYLSFYKGEISKTGYLPNLTTDERSVFNHAVLLAGYNKERKTFIAKNSFGAEWGKYGYFEIEKDYILDPEKAFDFYRVC